MEPLSIETLGTLARLQGLDLTHEELAALLPLVTAARSMMDPVRDALAGEIEPATQYRIL
jgi:hypothetical protein